MVNYTFYLAALTLVKMQKAFKRMPFKQIESAPTDFTAKNENASKKAKSATILQGF
jgi:hypothetical protein